MSVDKLIQMIESAIKRWKDSRDKICKDADEIRERLGEDLIRVHWEFAATARRLSCLKQVCTWGNGDEGFVPAPVENAADSTSTPGQMVLEGFVVELDLDRCTGRISIDFPKEYAGEQQEFDFNGDVDLVTGEAINNWVEEFKKSICENRRIRLIGFPHPEAKKKYLLQVSFVLCLSE